MIQVRVKSLGLPDTLIRIKHSELETVWKKRMLTLENPPPSKKKALPMWFTCVLGYSISIENNYSGWVGDYCVHLEWGAINITQTHDYQSYISVVDGVMDTKPDAVTRVTFIPSLMTFEEEMAEKFSKLMLTKSSPTESTSTTTWTVLLEYSLSSSSS